MTTRLKVPVIIFILLTAAALLGFAVLQNFSAKNQQLSVKPQQQYSKVELEPLESTIGLHTRLPYSSIISAAEHATREKQTGKGEKQTCKKVLGAKVCATLLWNYTIERDGDVEISSQGDQLQLKLPISFSGIVSVDGRGGKLLGLRNKDINGKLTLIADLDIDIAANWCPTLTSKVSYVWVSDPKIRLVGNIRLNLRKSVDRALQRKLTDLQLKLSELIDCDKFRQSVTDQWRVHTLAVEVTQNKDSTLKITPLNAAVSDIAIQPDHIGFAFELGATVELLQSPTQDPQPLTLPDLQPHTRTPGTVEFSLLLEIPYQQLRDTLEPAVVGKTYTSGTSNSVTVTSVDVYPSGQLLTIDVGFSANAMGNFLNTNGNIYITAKPVADPESNVLHLSELTYTREIDSRIVSALTAILRQQLLSALVDASTIDLGPSLHKIETSVEEALSDPAKTAGIPVTVKSPQVRLMALNPESDGLAAIVHLSTRLNATISEDVLIR